MIKILKTARINDVGATSIEYALIASIISLSIIVGATQIGSSLKGVFTTAATGFSNK